MHVKVLIRFFFDQIFSRCFPWYKVHSLKKLDKGPEITHTYTKILYIHMKRKKKKPRKLFAFFVTCKVYENTMLNGICDNAIQYN